MGDVIEATQSSFAQDVITRSGREPIVVDFWAPWCGPCRMLGPLLERLAQEPNSGFTLVKVNVDQHPALSQQYGVRGIPAVKAFVDGQIVADFVGAQPEPRVRQFIAEVKSKAGSANGRTPVDPQQAFERARLLLAQGNGVEAGNLLNSLAQSEQRQLRPLADFLCASGDYAFGGAAEQSQLQQQVANSLRSREPAAALYALLMLKQQTAAADRRRLDDVARAIITLFPQDSMVQSYQAQFG